MVPQKPPAIKNSVMEARMRTVDSDLTSFRAASNEAMVSQSMIWDPCITSRDAKFSPVMLRLTLASPMMEKNRWPDIIGTKTKRQFRADFNQNFEVTTWSFLKLMSAADASCQLQSVPHPYQFLHPPHPLHSLVDCSIDANHWWKQLRLKSILQILNST